jgi:hypothetical protein
VQALGISPGGDGIAPRREDGGDVDAPEQPTALLRRQTLQVLCGTPTSQKKNVTVPVGDSDMSPRSANNHSNATKARSSRRPH